jgi:UPF0042 nucleotide-binding protein
VVTGLSGGGKASILHALEDVGYDAMDNLPLGLLENLATRADRDIAIGIDARTRGFDADLVLETLDGLRRNPALLPELIFAWADEATLLRRYTETRRRHPLAPQGRVAEGIEIEVEMTARLREAADLIVDTSDLPLARLRRLIERRFGPPGDKNDARMAVTLMSFAFAKGLPKEADLVFDARFLRNPHYDPILRPRTGLDPEVGSYIREDADYAAYLSRITDLVDLVLPRFVHEGKKYATIAVGCTGGRHRSVFLIESLATHLSSRLAATRAAGESGVDWRQTVTHRELRPDNRATGPLSGEASLPRETDPRTSRIGGSQTGDSPAGFALSDTRSAAPDRAVAISVAARGATGEVRADGDGDKDRAGSGTGDLKTDHE